MTATELLTDLSRFGIEVTAHGDRLRYRPRSAVTPDLLERLRVHKAELLAILGPAARDAVIMDPAVDHPEPVVSWPEAVRWEDCIEPPEACPGCSGLLSWWNLLGDRRCMACDPPLKAIQALERAERIHRRHGIPNPSGAVEMLTDLKRLTARIS